MIRAAIASIRQNLFLAFVYNALGVPVAGRPNRIVAPAILLALLLLAMSARAGEAEHVHAPGTDPVGAEQHQHGAPADSSGASGHAQHEMGSMRHGAAMGHGAHAMPALYGPYSFTREASGTAWQPESAPHRGAHLASGAWSVMLHGFANLVADRQGGPRGDEKVFSSNMLMGVASRPLGRGRLGLRAMGSLEPATVGKRGYPLLLQTGETADGVTPLIDRQHPHDLFMELAGSYSVADATRAAFLYLGLPGEPALGPPVFMHRASGEDHPESPISHHWLDSTHITFGVATLGLVRGGLKLEASAFNGREPDQDRWNVESGALDSYSYRLSFNPTPDWALQASAGRLRGPEQLEPGVDLDRITASAGFHRRWGAWDLVSTAAWGRNRNRPGRTLDAWLIEGEASLGDRHTLLGRAERADKNELFEAGPRAGESFTVGRVEAGYICDAWRSAHLKGGVGVLGSVTLVPERLKGVYGDAPVSGLLFLRLRVI